MENKNNHYTKLGYLFNFYFSFESLSLIIKDIQTIGDLINFFQKKSISDFIILHGDKTFSKNTFFYFKYKQLISLYFKTIDFFETDYFMRIEYKLYKTNPKFFVSYFIFNLNYINEEYCQLILEINFENIFLNKLIVKESYQEFFQNCIILSNSIKKSKLNQFCNSNLLINSNYDLIINISTYYELLKLFLPNIKLISKIINNYNENDITNNDEKKITKNSLFNVIFKNKKKNKIFPNNFNIKVEKINSKKDFCFIRYKFLKYGNLKIIPIYSLDFLIRKISNNYTYVSIKILFNLPLPKHFINALEKYSNKALENLKNVCSKYSQKQKLKKIINL
jgi:hypothetical protein